MEDSNTSVEPVNFKLTNQWLDLIIETNKKILESLNRIDQNLTVIEQVSLDGKLAELYRRNHEITKKLNNIELTIEKYSDESCDKQEIVLPEIENKIVIDTPTTYNRSGLINLIKEKILNGKVSEERLNDFDPVITVMADIFFEFQGPQDEVNQLFDIEMAVIVEVIPLVVNGQITANPTELREFLAMKIFSKIWVEKNLNFIHE